MIGKRMFCYDRAERTVVKQKQNNLLFWFSKQTDKTDQNWIP